MIRRVAIVKTDKRAENGKIGKNGRVGKMVKTGIAHAKMVKTLKPANPEIGTNGKTENR